MGDLAFNTLYDYVLPYLRGVTTPLVDNEIRRVVRQFLRKSTLLRESLSLNLTAGNNVLTLTPTAPTPPTLEVAGVLQVAVNAGYANGGTTFNEIRQAPEDDVQRLALQTDEAPPRAFRYFPMSTLLLYPSPDAAYPVHVLVYETLTLDTANTTFPDVCAPYLDTIARGVIAECMMMPNKPFSEPQSAILYQRLYGDRVLALREELRQGGSAGVATARGPRFGV